MARLMQSPAARPRSTSGASSQYAGYGAGGVGGGVAKGQQQKQSLESLLADLTRLLSRLQMGIVYPDPERERRLRGSEYEREKARTNLEYARALLTRLEQAAYEVKIHNRRQELQADLNRKREIFEGLTERLNELEDMSIDSDAEDEGEDTDDTTEDLLSSIVMTPSESTNSRAESGGSDSHGGLDDDDDDDYDHDQHGWGDVGGDSRPSSQGQLAPQPEPEAETAQHATARSSEPQDSNYNMPSQPTTTTSQVRSRQSATTADKQDSAHTTQSSSARDQLFAGRSTKSATATTTSLSTTTATTEAILDHQRAEQDALTENLVRMAASLKKSSQAFSTSLEQERDVLDATGRSLEKNELGLEGASRRMGAIRKMSEGQGWLGRMKLYAMIFGMAVAAILLVFVLPKLRF